MNFQSFLSDLIVGIIAAAFGFLLSWLPKFLSKKQGKTISESNNYNTVDNINKLTGYQKLSSVYIIRKQEVKTEIHVDDRSAEIKDSSDDGLWLTVIGVLILLVALGSFWEKYKIIIFDIIMVFIGFGMGTSIYYINQLRKAKQPNIGEDIFLSWGGLFLWGISLVTSIFAVFNPLYDKQVVQKDSLGLISGSHLLGLIALFLSIILLAIVQVVRGRLFQKLTKNQTPNKLEIFLWDNRLVLYLIIGGSALFGVVFGTGLIQNLFYE